MTMKQPDSVVVHYHEIALKGDNRPLFIRRLINNIEKATAGLGVKKVIAPWGRMVIVLKEGSCWEEIQERLKGVFGIANFSPTWRIPREFDAIQEMVAALIAEKKFLSFKIASRRADKSFPLTSMELNSKLGKFVKDRTQARVDLENPECTIYVEVLLKEALLYIEKLRGPGGLPVGVAGPVTALLSGGIDSPVASYLMMKRGCTISFVHFHGYPYVTKASWEKAEELVAHLTQHQFSSRLFSIPFGDIQRQIVLSAPAPLRVVLYRRFMFRIAEEIAQKERSKSLITGESLGQVASQTLDNLAVIQEAADLPILRPLIGTDKEEIIVLAKKIGTYPISIQPDQDCCSLFIPRHPSVRARLEDIRRVERQLDCGGLVKMGLEGVTVQEFDSRS